MDRDNFVNATPIKHNDFFINCDGPASPETAQNVLENQEKII